MFRKLISNLPFNPSLVSQVSFYTKRVQQEASVRRMGFGLIALAMFIQMFAVIAPPERSLAASDNHIINGLRTRTDILTAWDGAGSDIPAIYGKFGLTRADIAKLPMSPNTTLKSNSGPDYWTIGRNSLSNYANVNYLYKLTEVALTVSPTTTVYMRQLRAWDIRNPFNTYQAFTGVKDKARIQQAKVELGLLSQSLKRYEMISNVLPAALDALSNKPSDADAEWVKMLDKPIAKDPWGSPYEYSVNGSEFVLKSIGPDRQTGTADDISS